MIRRQALEYFILVMSIIKCVRCFDAFITKTINDKNEDHKPLTSFHNNSLEIPLFQARYITLRMNLNHDFRHHHKHVDSIIVGFKFQILVDHVVFGQRVSIILPQHPIIERRKVNLSKINLLIQGFLCHF